MANSGLNISGIYKIESKIHPDRCYIGSANNIRWRRNGHLWALKEKKHKNPKLQSHFNKYGIDDIKFSILAVCDKKELIPENNVVWIEQCFLLSYKPWFNICKWAGSPVGTKKTQEQIEKSKGRVVSAETRNKMRLHKIGNIPWNKGMKGQYKMPEGVFIERSEKRRGVKRPKFSDEWIENLSKSHMGHKDSEETKKKKSEAGKHRVFTDKHRENLSKANYGKKRPPLTEENKENLSQAMKEWWRKRKELVQIKNEAA